MPFKGPPKRPPKSSRAKSLSMAPTPTTASTNPSDAALDPDQAVNSLSIAELTLDVPIVNKRIVRKPKPKPFDFLGLPVEIRLQIYEYFFADMAGVLDIEHGNRFTVYPKLRLFRVCRTVYWEASKVFYGCKVFRIFPIDGRQSRAKKGLLARAKPRCRALIKTLELRLGPGWSKPFRSWQVNDQLGLADCVNVQSLHVYMEIDPSQSIFAGHRKFPGFYEKFCQELLDEILKGIPSVKKVQFDAHPSVLKKGDMARGLLEIAMARQLTICWGPCRGWTDADEEEEEDKKESASPDPDPTPTTIPAPIPEFIANSEVLLASFRSVIPL
ncbi:unnamed protein product [Discula destructiva]